MKTKHAQLQHIQPGWQVQTGDGEWSTIRARLEYTGHGSNAGKKAVKFVFTDGSHSSLYSADIEIEVRRP